MDNLFVFLLKAAEQFKIDRSRNGIPVNIDNEILRTITDEFKTFPFESLNEFVEDDIILAKDAAVLELIVMRHMPLKANPEIIQEVNALFAMNLATMLLFNTNELVLHTRQYISVDVPFENSLENHLTWLRQVQFKETLPTLTFSNATFWTLISIIFNNKHNFISV